MHQHQGSLRVGAAAICCALGLRLLAGGILTPVINWLLKPETTAFLIYLETGRNVRFSPSLAEISNSAGESPPPQLPVAPVINPPVFEAGQAQDIEIAYSCGYRPDLGALLAQPLGWDLTVSEPTVLIIHTHATESYTRAPEEDYEESAAFRTLDTGYNMVSIGDRLTQVLTAGGITVIHDRQLLDHPSYNGSYTRAREVIQEWLKKYPSIQLVLDLHRDASGDLNNQMKTGVTWDGVDYAGMMLVMGTNASGQYHPKWKENLALGLKLQCLLEEQVPGITRPISLRPTRFNQDLTAGSLLIEMGAAGDTREKALHAAEQLGEALLALARGSE